MNNNEMLLLKLGEVVLKGLNRHSFEDKLVNNVRRRMKNCGSFQIYIRQSTIYVEPQSENCDMEGAYQAAKQIFGIVTVARAVPCEKTIDAIVETAKTYLAGEFANARTFKVESKRADKHFYLNSIQISQEVGGLLAEAFPDVAVDVHDPDLTVHVEIREKYAYVHAPSVAGAGGLPIGMGGHAVSLLSGGLDSPVSSYMIARRGVILDMVHFVSPPYTSQQAQDKVMELAQILTTYCGRMIVHIIPFTEIQEEIRKNCPEEYFTLIMRRFMMRLAEAVAVKAGASALVTGESLGQVASQTIKALGVTEDVTHLPVLRPLIGSDKVEIIRTAREIGTYDTSILPYEDCCTVFTPRHPATRPVLEDVVKAESVLDIDGLVEKALAGETWVRLKPNM
ncbi:MAG: tRNA 4-thiouridine(8) synthase ThiI [Oscillibacter sp.]|nr:tRNA 4-thiouridine(8) synthase ThiI [Oscillibacter sp.]